MRKLTLAFCLLVSFAEFAGSQDQVLRPMKPLPFEIYRLTSKGLEKVAKYEFADDETQYKLGRNFYQKSDGSLLTTPKGQVPWLYCEPFKNGVARVLVGDWEDAYWIQINPQGKLIKKLGVFEDLVPGSPKSSNEIQPDSSPITFAGLVDFQTGNGLHGLMSAAGTVVYPPEFDYISLPAPNTLMMGRPVYAPTAKDLKSVVGKKSVFLMPDRESIEFAGAWLVCEITKKSGSIYRLFAQVNSQKDAEANPPNIHYILTDPQRKIVTSFNSPPLQKYEYDSESDSLELLNWTKESNIVVTVSGSSVTKAVLFPEIEYHYFDELEPQGAIGNQDYQYDKNSYCNPDLKKVNEGWLYSVSIWPPNKGWYDKMRLIDSEGALVNLPRDANNYLGKKGSRYLLGMGKALFSYDIANDSIFVAKEPDVTWVDPDSYFFTNAKTGITTLREIEKGTTYAIPKGKKVLWRRADYVCVVPEDYVDVYGEYWDLPDNKPPTGNTLVWRPKGRGTGWSNAFVNDNKVRLRAGPSLDASIITELDKGTAVEILGLDDHLTTVAGYKGIWVHIRGMDSSIPEGWTFSQFIAFRNFRLLI